MSTKKKPGAGSSANAGGTTASGRKVIRAVTAQVIKFLEDQPRVVKITGAMHISSRKNLDDKRKMEPATVCDAIDVTTGETGVIVCNKVMVGNLSDQYPDEGYVGRVFEITKRAKKKGGKFEYWPFDIIEVEE